MITFELFWIGMTDHDDLLFSGYQEKLEASVQLSIVTAKIITILIMRENRNKTIHFNGRRIG